MKIIKGILFIAWMIIIPVDIYAALTRFQAFFFFPQAFFIKLI